jgi:hypothetical protein
MAADPHMHDLVGEEDSADLRSTEQSALRDGVDDGSRPFNENYGPRSAAGTTAMPSERR